MSIKEERQDIPWLPLAGYAIAYFLFYAISNLLHVHGKGAEGGFWRYTALLQFLVVIPIVTAGVLGGIWDVLRRYGTDDPWRFLSNVLRYAPRFFLVNILLVLAWGMLRFVLFAVGLHDPDAMNPDSLMYLLHISVSAVILAWYVGMVVEDGKMGRGFVRGVRALATNWRLLCVGLLWGGAVALDDAIPHLLDMEEVAGLHIARAVILAVLRVGVLLYAVGAYWAFSSRVYGDADTAEAEAESRHPSVDPGGSLAWTSLVLGLVSFVPLLGIAAFVAGWMVLKRYDRFSVRGAFACVLGAFFTALYAFGFVGSFLPRGEGAADIGYAFLVEADPWLSATVDLLEASSFDEALAQLGEDAESGEQEGWAWACASGIAKRGRHELRRGIEDFERAAEHEPLRSEFYYYYGCACLESGELEKAAENFELAVAREPQLPRAKRLLALTQSAYNPSRMTTGVWFIIILLILFPAHGYVQAYAAWKLGDDTAKKVGRLTLNPFAHLVPVGSVLLPALFSLAQINMVFGWARPVPVNAEKLRDPKRHRAMIALAGPAMYSVIAMACILLLVAAVFLARILSPGLMTFNLNGFRFPAISMEGLSYGAEILPVLAFVKHLMYTSMALGMCSLIPIPPFDGSWILSTLLPENLHARFEKLRPYKKVNACLVILMSPLLVLMMILSLSFALAALSWTLGPLVFG